MSDYKLDSANQRLKREAVFDQDRRVQAFLEDHRNKTLERVYRYLVTTEIDQLPCAQKDILALLPNDEYIRRAAALAMDDGDFMLMLERVHEKLREKTHVQSPSPSIRSPVPAEIGETRSSDLAAEFENEVEIIRRLTAYSKNRRRGL